MIERFLSELGLLLEETCSREFDFPSRFLGFPTM